MQTIRILIPAMRPPYVHSMEAVQIKNIMERLKEKCNLQLIWIVFQPDSIKEIRTQKLQVINFHNYDNAIDILNEMKPDLVLIDGELQASNLTFAVAAKFKKIPVVATYFIEEFEGFGKRWFALKSRLRLAISNRVFADISTGSNPKKFAMFHSIIKKYSFLMRTLKKMNYNIFKITVFLLVYTTIQLFSNSENPLHKWVTGDLNLCTISQSVQRLEKMGLEKSSLILIGNPYFDGLYQQIQKIRQTHPIHKEMPRILFCNSPMYEHGMWTKKEEEDMIVRVINEIMNHNEFEIAIKIHPSSSSIDEYTKLLEKLHRKVPIYQKENLVELLNVYDVMLTYGSGSQLLDAILFKKPIVFLNLLHKYQKLNLHFDEKLMTLCTTLDQLVLSIKESISNNMDESAYQSYVEKHLGRFDGKSSERAAIAILELINKRQ